tara:strand:+ start:313 stop:417 length:105 start_codon:yes stop_codon:yes gene_type:complete
MAFSYFGHGVSQFMMLLAATLSVFRINDWSEFLV